MDPEGAAIEQLYKKGTSLRRPWRAEQESQQKGGRNRNVQWLRLWSKSARVQILPVPPQRFMTLASYISLSASVSPSVKWEIIPISDIYLYL